MAHNLAFSLRHFAPDIQIHLWCSEPLLDTVNNDLFAQVRTLPKEFYTHPTTGKTDPARAKVQIYRLGCEMGLDDFLYLDVDAVCLQDIRPFIDRLKGRKVATRIEGKGGRNDTITYSIWATNNQIWQHFKLPETATLPSVQSSWMWFERSRLGDAIQSYCDHFFAQGIPNGGLKHFWGGPLSMPDELIYQGVFAKLGIIPDHTDNLIFFGHSRATLNEVQVRDQFPLLSLYGNGNGTNPLTHRKWWGVADATLNKMGGTWYPTALVMNDKWANEA